MSALPINPRKSPTINLPDSNRGKFGVVHRVPPLPGEPEWVVSEGETRAEAVAHFFNESDAWDYAEWRGSSRRSETKADEKKLKKVFDSSRSRE